MIDTDIAPEWIAADWGTSRLRVWAMVGSTPIAANACEQGMAGLAPDAFEPALLSLIEPWLGDNRMTVLACGMVGARQGWAEAPYRPVPCAPASGDVIRAHATDPRLDICILPGLKQNRPADVMRGEETQIAGVLAKHAQFDGVLCLPGTHTKWAQISAGEVVSFRTFMTGEMFDVMFKHSVLRHSLPDVAGAHADWDEATFTDALEDALAKPEAVAARLFSIRAEGLLNDQPAHVAQARLSGLLVGMELAAARPYWLGQRVIVVGTGPIVNAYSSALSTQGIVPHVIDGNDMSIAGLSAAYHSFVESIL